MSLSPCRFSFLRSQGCQSVITRKASHSRAWSTHAFSTLYSHIFLNFTADHVTSLLRVFSNLLDIWMNSGCLFSMDHKFLLNFVPVGSPLVKVSSPDILKYLLFQVHVLSHSSLDFCIYSELTIGHSFFLLFHLSKINLIIFQVSTSILTPPREGWRSFHSPVS